jgi:hypothetical protein
MDADVSKEHAVSIFRINPEDIGNMFLWQVNIDV